MTCEFSVNMWILLQFDPFFMSPSPFSRVLLMQKFWKKHQIFGQKFQELVPTQMMKWVKIWLGDIFDIIMTSHLTLIKIPTITIMIKQ